MYLEDFAHDLGRTAHEILRYQQIGLLRPRRDERGRAVYGDAERRRISVIAKGEAAGFTPEELMLILKHMR